MKHGRADVAQQLRRMLKEIRIGSHAACWIAAEARIAPHVGALHGAVLHIEGQGDVGRARPAGSHLIEGGTEDAGDVLRAVEHCVPFGHRSHERALVESGQGVAPARGDGDVGVDAKDRHGGFVSFGETGEYIGRTAATGPLAHADLARDTRIAVRHVGCRAFVARQDVTHAVRQPRQRIIKRQTSVAAQAEEDLDIVRLQHLDNGFGAGQCGGLRRDGFVHCESRVVENVICCQRGDGVSICPDNLKQLSFRAIV